MIPINSETLKEANKSAKYIVLLYLTNRLLPEENETVRSYVERYSANTKDISNMSTIEKYRLQILKNSIIDDALFSESIIADQLPSKAGLKACSFFSPDNTAYIAYRGTVSGEWLDNGEGLSGIPEENTYITYGKDGEEVERKTVSQDYATDNQTEALNFFNKTVFENGWDENTDVIVSGHSKGGNKAQFIGIHSDIPKYVFSFDGQGFSPEALGSFKDQFGESFETRRERIYSISADNDYVNVLGDRLVTNENIFFFESDQGIHFLEAILDENGNLRAQCEQGTLSKYTESVSEELMKVEPFFRKFATNGLMNIFDKYVGNDNNKLTTDDLFGDMDVEVKLKLQDISKK